MSIPILDLAWISDPQKKPRLLEQLQKALFDVGFLYIRNHGVPQAVIDRLAERLPALFGLSNEQKASLAKIHSPHFVGYNGYAEETTLGKQDLREQFDFATELPIVYSPKDEVVNGGNDAESSDDSRDFSNLYWRLRGPNQWPTETVVPGFRDAFIAYHDALAELSYRFVHLIEEAFEIAVGTYDHFFGRNTDESASVTQHAKSFLPPQHRIKLLRYPPIPSGGTSSHGQGVGPHKDSSGWLTFLYQVGSEPGLEVLSSADGGTWIPAPPVPGTFVVNFGNAFEAATEGAVRATTHRVVAPRTIEDGGRTRYSIPFFMGLPSDVKVSEIRALIPEQVRNMRAEKGNKEEFDQFVSAYLDPRWDSLGDSVLRKWIRSHKDVGEKWYGADAVRYYTA